MRHLRFIFIALAFWLPLGSQSAALWHESTSTPSYTHFALPNISVPVISAQLSGEETGSLWFYDDIDDDEWESSVPFVCTAARCALPPSDRQVQAVRPLLRQRDIKLFVLFCCFKFHC